MPNASDSLGATDDAVRLELDDNVVVVAESYEVARAVFTRQPCVFALRLGWGDVIKDLAKKIPPKTQFSLFVGNVLQFTGETDGFEMSGETGATELVVRGRDDLANLHEAFIDGDESYSNISYLDLTRKCLDKAGIKGYSIVGSNDANRKAVTGTQITTVAPVLDGEKPVPGLSVANAIRFKAGARRFEALKKELDKAGLFLWAGTDKTFILSAPNANQKPAYRIIRQRGQTRNAVNVVSARWQNDTAKRYSACAVYAKCGGTKFGRQEATARFVDEEMTALGFENVLVIRNSRVKDKAQAEKLARRKISEANRAAWQLSYTVAGHTIPSLFHNERAVLAPDTVVDVQDDEFGITDQLYLESVTFKRSSSGTLTDLVLMKREHLVFDAGEFEES